MSESSILSAIILSPVVGLLLILLIPREQKYTIKVVSALSALVTVILSGMVWRSYDSAVGGFQFVQEIPWVENFGISFSVGVDGIGVAMTALNALIFFTGVLSMWRLEERVKEYFAFMLLLVIGVFGVFVTIDLFFFFFFYEIAVLPMYPLVAIWGSTRKVYAAMKLTLFLMGGSALLFPALIAIYWMARGPDFNSWNILQLALRDFPHAFQVTVYPFLYLGFGVLAGMFPFHSWSPTGHVAAPTAVSMLHAGVLMKLGAFGILRVAMTLLPYGAQYWAGPFAILATVNIVYGAFVAMRQTDFKFVIGFSSVSHMGIVLLGLNTLTLDSVNGGVFQMFAHGVMTALFFSSVGFIYDQAHVRDIRRFGGLARQIPVAVSFFMIAGLCGMGVPGFASFWAELLVFVAAIKVYPWLGVFAVGGLVITAIYMLRVFGQAFFGPVNSEWDHLGDPNAWDMVPRVILIATLIFFGFYPNAMLNLITSSTKNFLGGF
jgi:NADH-quinone oxidoreductase subunit M